MRIIKIFMIFVPLTLLIFSPIPAFSQLKGLKTITEDDLRMHLEFIAADEFRGRETPSPELEICNLYLAGLAKRIGLMPLMPDGSYFQTIPLSVTSVSKANTRLRLISGEGEMITYYQESFGGNFRNSGSFSGDVVFTGFGLSAPEEGWDDCGEEDLSGKVVVILDAQLPESHELAASANRLWARAYSLRDRGAAAVLSVVDPERERKKMSGMDIFFSLPRGRMDVSFETQRTARSSRASSRQPVADRSQRPPLPFAHAEICHDLASAILDVSKSELSAMFAKINQGQPVPGRVITGKRIDLKVEVETRPGTARSVLGLVEGSDPILKNEYVVVCAHQDHLGVQNGEVMNGADDNGSGTVALIEIAQALMTENPRRSVIIAWFTGEERGLLGSHFFVNNCPVPLEKISACLNMDMLCRNDPGRLFLVASDLLSSELDGAIRRMNSKHGINFAFDYAYSNRTHPQRVYYRSDQYPHIRFGIPSVWFFCGFTPDYHTPRDDLEFVDFKKMLKAAQLVYLTAYEIGMLNGMLKLDVNPDVTARGAHNLTVESIK